MIYADSSYYFDVYGGTVLDADTALRYLKQASQHADSLTYNRIVGKGFDNLTEFQKETVKEFVCRQADFEYENQDILKSVLSSYSINGVSMSFGSNWRIDTVKGIAVEKDVYALISQTGLTSKLISR